MLEDFAQRSRTPVTPAGDVGTKTSMLNGARSAGGRKGATADLDAKMEDHDARSDIHVRAPRDDTPIFVPEAKESELHKQMKEILRGARVGVHELDHHLEGVSQRSEARIDERDVQIGERARVEDERAQMLRLNTEVQEQMVLEVDTKMAQQQQARAARLYAKKQIELGLPPWLRTLEELVSLVQAEGHSEKLRWRSKACGMMKRAILESESDAHAEESRGPTVLREMVLRINQYKAADVVGHCARIKDQYIDTSKSANTKFGRDTALLQESERTVDTTSVVPLERTDWSAKLDDADLSRQSLALHSTESWSTLSRPSTLSGGDISSYFSGDPRKLGASAVVDKYGASARAAELLPGTGPPAKASLPKPVLKSLPESQKRGGIKGGKYQIHPACMNQEQAQGVARMRSAAAMGNFELVRSLFFKNFDTPKRVRAFYDTDGYKKLSVGKNAPNMDVFRILMMAFKNADDIRFEHAFEVVDIVESYGFSPDTAMYNIMMRACERESRWRRAIAMYRDLIHVHDLTPNVQTFDILIDCCRHSIEDPGVIYESLRGEDLPHEFCYKAAVCNCGNRIPLQVIQETMHDVEAKGPPDDGRFEREVERERQLRGGTGKPAKSSRSPGKGSPGGSPGGKIEDISVVTFDATLEGGCMSRASASGGNLSKTESGHMYEGGMGLNDSTSLNAYANRAVIANEDADVGKVLDASSLAEKKKAYKWDRFQTEMKKRLPSKSPVVNGDFGKTNKAFNTHLMRSLPHEESEYLEMHAKSHYPAPKREPTEPGGGAAREGYVLGGDHAVVFTGSISHQRHEQSVTLKRPPGQASVASKDTRKGNSVFGINDDTLLSASVNSQQNEPNSGLVQPSWISDVEGSVAAAQSRNPCHIRESYTSHPDHSSNRLPKSNYIARSATKPFVDPYIAGTDLIPEEKRLFSVAASQKRSGITFSTHEEGNSTALERWRERKEILEQEAILLEQARTPINPASVSFFEDSEPPRAGAGASVGGSIALATMGTLGNDSSVLQSTQETLSLSQQRLNMTQTGAKKATKTDTRPSPYGYNATRANKEHREKKKTQWEAAEQQQRDVVEYKLALEKRHQKERFAAGLSPTSAATSVAPGSLLGGSGEDSTILSASMHTAPDAGDMSSADSFQYTRMLEQVEEERRQQKVTLMAAKEHALRKNPDRKPKYRARTYQGRQKPLVKLPDSQKIMAAVASQIVLGENHVEGVRFRASANHAAVVTRTV